MNSAAVAPEADGQRGHLSIAPAANHRTTELGGVRLSDIPFEDGLELLLNAPLRGQRLRVHFVSPRTLVVAGRHPALRDVLNSADITGSDGRAPAAAGWRRREHGGLEAAAVMDAVFDRSRWLGESHFFYGDTAEAASALASAVTGRFPGLSIAGAGGDSCGLEDVESIAGQVNASGADFVWISLNALARDYVLALLRPLVHAAVLLAIPPRPGRPPSLHSPP